MSNSDDSRQDLPSMEMVILAFQKGLARASQATNDASKHDPNFLTGRRTLFAVNSLDIKLHAGLKMAKRENGGVEDTIRVDFDAPVEARSQLKFIVESKPLEPVEGPRVLLSRLFPLTEEGKENEFLVWTINKDNQICARQEIVLQFTPVGSDKNKKRIRTMTDLTGQLKFSIDPVRGLYHSSSESKPVKSKLDMTVDWVVSAGTGHKKPIVSVELPIYRREV